MVIILKLICFSIWMIIMLVLLAGGRNNSRNFYKKVTLVLDDDDDTEMRIRQVLDALQPEDRLMILDKGNKRNITREYIVSMFLRKNPSVMYGRLEETFA